MEHFVKSNGLFISCFRCSGLFRCVPGCSGAVTVCSGSVLVLFRLCSGVSKGYNSCIIDIIVKTEQLFRGYYMAVRAKKPVKNGKLRANNKVFRNFVKTNGVEDGFTYCLINRLIF